MAILFIVLSTRGLGIRLMCRSVESAFHRQAASAVLLGLVLVPVCLAVTADSAVASLLASEPGGTQQTVSFGSLSPTALGAPRTVVLPVRLSVPSTAAREYRVRAVATFVFTPATPTQQGRTLTASDIGVGIASVSPAGRAGSSERHRIAAGFDYDPAVVNRADGVIPYQGATVGRATLADLLAGREILRGEKRGDLVLTIKLGVLSQFVTPGTFSGTIMLAVSDGG
jgi:hypothetical protein